MDWIERGIWFFTTGLILAEITRFANLPKNFLYPLMLFGWPILAPLAIIYYHMKLGGKNGAR